MRRVIWLRIPTVFWFGGGINSFSYWTYVWLVMLGEQK